MWFCPLDGTLLQVRHSSTTNNNVGGGGGSMRRVSFLLSDVSVWLGRARRRTGGLPHDDDDGQVRRRRVGGVDGVGTRGPDGRRLSDHGLSTRGGVLPPDTDPFGRRAHVGLLQVRPMRPPVEREMNNE